MGKKKKETMELRFYEVPQNEYVLALLGDSWIRDYGHDETNLHFHNLMEIGYCRNGRGQLVLDEDVREYEPAMVSIIPSNFPHITISNQGAEQSFWEYLFLDPMQILEEMYPEDPLYRHELLERINKKASFLYEWENRNLALLVKMIMEEVRSKKPHYAEKVKGLAIGLVTEILRSNESDPGVKEVRKKNGVGQIAEALDFVKNEYAQNIKIADLADACHMSETHFRRIFEAYMNMSPMDYINLIRIQNACDLMKKSNDSMDVVAQKVGFSTTSTFNRNFKKFLDTSPYQWKIKPENYERKLLNFKISALKGW